MKNITFAIDEEVLDKARVVAAQRKTTVSAMVREFLTEISNGDERRERARAELLELMRTSKGRLRADYAFSREDSHER
jgi:antitoxin component of RelBE/YafQ-DinJ toxin-antitoxin module